MLQKIFIKSESILILGLLILSGLLHGWNMFGYPYFENDEGTYFSQAWSFLSQGKLAPYTYWYDHAPLGWIFTSLWLFLTGGPFRFGFSLNSARAFILILHLASTFLLFKITKKITNSQIGATIACLFFMISPLAIYFQRRFLLDNIMIFWVLLSLFLILFSQNKLWRYFLSAIAFGIAVLTKENAIFFMPVLAGLVATQAHHHHKKFAVIKWIAIALMIISLYPLYALLKKEFFPMGSFFSPVGNHVSLLGTLLEQTSRGSNLPFWNPKSDFQISLGYWLTRDPFFIILGFTSFLIQGVLSLINKNSRLIFLLTLSFLAFLVSGKLVINFYIIPLIPLFGLCIGATITELINLSQKTKKIHLDLTLQVLISLITFGLIFFYYSQDIILKQAFTTNETANQIAAVNWVKKNIPADKTIATDYFGSIDLINSRFPSDPKMINAFPFIKIEEDPEIRQTRLNNNSQQIDYMMVSAQMYRDVTALPRGSSILQNVISGSSLVRFFSNDNKKGFILPQYPISQPNGNWVAILKQQTTAEKLSLSQKSFAAKFIQPSGIVTDTQNKNINSSTQAMMLLQLAIGDDKQDYDKVLSWTNQNMQLSQTNLYASEFGKTKSGSLGIVNKGTTTQTDENIALSLIVAYHRWNDPIYLDQARKIIPEIWQNETVAVQNQRYVVAGDWTSDSSRDFFTVNPANILPFAYRQFAIADPSHDWGLVLNSSYDLLNKCSAANLGVINAQFLPPNWCDITKDGKAIPALEIDKENSSNFSYSAPQVLLNLALDYSWYQDIRDKNYLNQVSKLNNDYLNLGQVYSNYTHAGDAITDSESQSTNGFLLSQLAITNKAAAEKVYNDKILPSISNDGQRFYWTDPSNLFDQNWVWWAVAVYAGNLPPL